MEVSLIAQDAVRDPQGLCSARFRADIETSGVDYTTLSVGDAVTVGDVTYIITRVGKRCHAECALVQAGRTCQLKDNCAFAEPTQARSQNAGKNQEA